MVLKLTGTLFDHDIRFSTSSFVLFNLGSHFLSSAFVLFKHNVRYLSSTFVLFKRDDFVICCLKRTMLSDKRMTNWKQMSRLSKNI